MFRLANGFYHLSIDQINDIRNTVSAFPAPEHVEVLITDSPSKNTVIQHDIKQKIIRRKEQVSLTFLKKYICLQTQKIEGAKKVGVN